MKERSLDEQELFWANLYDIAHTKGKEDFVGDLLMNSNIHSGDIEAALPSPGDNQSLEEAAKEKYPPCAGKDKVAQDWNDRAQIARNAFIAGAFHERADKSQLKRLYDWIMDENRQGATTFFTSGWLRNVAKEIEYRLSGKGGEEKHSTHEVLKDSDAKLTELKKDPNHITTQLNKDEHTSYNTGFHTGWCQSYVYYSPSRPSIDIVDEWENKATKVLRKLADVDFPESIKNDIQELLNQSK